MQKILILAETFPSVSRPYYNGGVEVIVEQLVEKFKKEGKVTLLYQSKQTSGILYLPQLLRTQIVYFRQALKLKPNLVVATNHTTYLTGILISKVLGIPLILYWHDLLKENWLKYFGLTGVFGWVVETISRRINCDHWTNSQATKDKLEKSDALVVPPVFHTGPSHLGRTRIEKVPGTILMVSRLVNYKRVDLAIKIFSKVKKQEPNAKLVIVGNGPEKTKILKLIGNLGLKESVEIKSNISHKELTKLYQESSTFLHLSLIEGYCLVIQEALNYGCKVVATYLPVLAETTKGKEDVHLFNKNRDIANFLTENSELQIALMVGAWNPPSIGGTQTHVLELSKTLVKKHGLKIDIFTRNLLGDNKNEFPKKEILTNGLQLFRVGSRSKFENLVGKVIFILVVPYFVIKKSKESRYCLIHAQGLSSAISGKIASLFLGIPFVLTIHSNYSKLSRTNPLLYILEKILLKCVSADTTIFVSAKNDTLSKNTVYIPNGVDIKRFNSSGINKSGAFRFLFVGRIDWMKGLDTLIRAVSLINKRHLDSNKIEFHVVGSGPKEEEYKLLMAKYMLDKYFLFKGRLEGNELVKEYKSSKIFILPSTAEGQPLVLLEAMAASLPIITTYEADSANIINKSFGWKIEANDDKLLAQTIIKVATTPNKELLKMGHRATKEATNYSWENTASKTSDIYRKLTN